MESRQRIRSHAMAALDYALQAKVGLIMSGRAEAARDFDPLIQSIRRLLEELTASERAAADPSRQRPWSRSAGIYHRSSSRLRQREPVMALWPVASLTA